MSQTSDDCNVLGITGRVCAADAKGVDYCADPWETDGGVLSVAPPTGAPVGSAVVEPTIDGGQEASTEDEATDDATDDLVETANADSEVDGPTPDAYVNGPAESSTRDGAGDAGVGTSVEAGPADSAVDAPTRDGPGTGGPDAAKTPDATVDAGSIDGSSPVATGCSVAPISTRHLCEDSK